MAIVMMQGPDSGPDVPGQVQDALESRAQAAGLSMVRVRCENSAQLVERLSRIDRGNADIILLDPGRCAGDGALQVTLRQLPVPYVEVHVDRHERSCPHPPAAALASRW